MMTGKHKWNLGMILFVLFCCVQNHIQTELTIPQPNSEVCMDFHRSATSVPTHPRYPSGEGKTKAGRADRGAGEPLLLGALSADKK